MDTKISYEVNLTIWITYFICPFFIKATIKEKLFIMDKINSLKQIKCLLEINFFIGYGLINEACPKHTVACGIRIENEAIQFYDSALYDRSQLVCVGKNDFVTEDRSGCIRKKTGLRFYAKKEFLSNNRRLIII